MKIKSFQGGYDKNISYLIYCDSNRTAGIIDASVETVEIVEIIKTLNLKLEKIFITHTHFDHISFLEDLKYQFPQVQVCGFKKPEQDMGDNYRKLNHHEIIPFAGELITALHTPGHYPDSMCYWNKNESCLFTGDTMFVGRTGRTVGIRSNISHLYSSVYDILLGLPEETMIYPGHHYGHKSSLTIKENIALSSFFQCKSEKEFIQVMENFENNRRIE